MILGGFGFLSRMRGLSIDNVVEVEMVLADGKIVVVNKDEDPGAYIYTALCHTAVLATFLLSYHATDLWWAVRGAGPAFGIATRYKARAYPVPMCFAGNLI